MKQREIYANVENLLWLVTCFMPFSKNRCKRLENKNSGKNER